MKKIIICALVGLCFLVVSTPGYTNSDDYKTKLKEGFETIITSPKPLIDAVKEEYNAAEFKPFGVVGGFFKGSFYAVGQFSRGVYRVLTFNVWDDNFVSKLFNKEGTSE